MHNVKRVIRLALVLLLSAGLMQPVLAVDNSQFNLDLILAKRGDADAQYYVANAYEEGRGVDKNLTEALDWYSKAAAQEHHGSQYKLGTLYENGLGVERDIGKAFEWYKKAADNGSTLASERVNKAAFARSEQVMQRRIEQMKAEQQEQERDRRQAEQRRQQQEAERARQQRAAAAAAARPAAAPAARAAPAAAVNVPDILDVVLGHKWFVANQAADYLPSNGTNCLQAAGDDVVCFSSERQRVINGQQVTYTTKANLTNFRPNGSFRVKYNYNVVRLAAAGEAGVNADPHGLKLEQGWQEQQELDCQTTDRINLYCSRGSQRFHYRR